MLCLSLAPTPTWRLTLTDAIRLLQSGVSVAGQVLSDHAALGQKGDEDGEADRDDENGHQELPVFRGIFCSCPSACQRKNIYIFISQKNILIILCVLLLMWMWGPPCFYPNLIFIPIDLLLWSGLNSCPCCSTMAHWAVWRNIAVFSLWYSTVQSCVWCVRGRCCAW